MKCPNCGGENSGNFCQFCGSEMPKTITPVNITNNYFGTDSEQQNLNGGSCCPKCGSAKIGFKRERTGTNSRSSSRKKYIGTGRKGTYNSTASYRTIGLCQSCGFTWSPDSVSGNSGSSSNAPTWLWVLGWIFIFPLPLTVLLLRNKSMNKSLKYGIIAAAWFLYLIIVFSSRANKKSDAGATSVSNSESVVTTLVEDTTVSDTTSATETTESKEIDLGLYIDNIVQAYNKQATEQLVYVEDFTPSDKNSGHYRTEFRLDAWQDALGKSYTLGDIVVDLVVDPQLLGDVGFRVYANNLSLEQVHALVQGMSPLMDEELSASDLNDALYKVDNDHEANGYYYGKLGLLLLKRSENGYELMIKRD